MLLEIIKLQIIVAKIYTKIVTPKTNPKGGTISLLNN